jgi:hypothetical protein
MVFVVGVRRTAMHYMLLHAIIASVLSYLAAVQRD